MKLRNKKTGEIKYLQEVIHQVYQDHNLISLNKLNEEWEDYEEPKEYWFVNDLDGKPMKCELRYCPVRDFDDWVEKRKLIGNCFETEEEAEKAVEKLKAWRRLKYNCGISFSGLNRDRTGKPVSVNLEFDKEGRATFDEAVQNVKDLTLLFGGEE